jgi:transposase
VIISLKFAQTIKINRVICSRITARTVAHLVNVNKSITLRLRKLIYTRCEALEMCDGEVEVDESYFSGRRKGNRDRGGFR